MLFVLLALIVIMPSTPSYAAVPTPHVGEARKWRTGEIDVHWLDVQPGNMVTLYITTFGKQGAFEAHDVWIANEPEGYHISQFFENGQSVWYYIKQYNPTTGETSPPSNIIVSTPPATVFVTNWPDMLKDLNKSLDDALAKAMTPSDATMVSLTDAINGLKNAVGAGQAANAGGGLQNGLDGISGGLKPPLVVDDGNGTYTGGNTGGQLPFTPGGGAGSGLNVPNPDSGTSNEMTMRIPYGVDMQGNMLYVKILTNEQLEKMKWLGLIRSLAVAATWIMFGFWLVGRFTPQLKV